MTNMPAESIPLRDTIIEQIRRTITSQNLKPGDRLPTEEQWAKQLGVSRVSIREALKALEFLGIIHSAPKRGTTVGTLNLDRIISLLKFQFSVNQITRADLLKARQAIESGIMPQVAERMADDPSIYDRLYALTEKHDINDDFETYFEADVAFHRLLIEAGGVQPLTTFCELLEVFFREFRGVMRDHGRWATHGVMFHRQMIEALRQGDVATARAVHHEALRVYREHNHVGQHHEADENL